VRWLDASSEERREALQGVRALAAFRRAVPEPSALMLSRQTVTRLLGEPLDRDPRSIRLRLEEAISAGRVLVLETREPLPLTQSGLEKPTLLDLPLFADPPPELRTIELERRYHDDDPLQGATYELILQDGRKINGRLDESGRAVIDGVPPGVAHVRFGPDSRPWERVDQRENPEFKPSFSEADADALITRYAGGA